eukprot:5877787-Pleurochrysis_carterae.AAC.1
MLAPCKICFKQDGLWSPLRACLYTLIATTALPRLARTGGCYMLVSTCAQCQGFGPVASEY